MPLGMTPGRFATIWFLGGIATITLLGVATGSGGQYGWLAYWRLMKGGETAEATVVRIEPSNHCRAEYRFAVGGLEYSGAGALCSSAVGAKVSVTYLRSDPAHSCLGAARDQFWNDVIPITLAGVIGPPFLLGMNLLRRRRRHD